jgi:hypothetical protein
MPLCGDKPLVVRSVFHSASADIFFVIAEGELRAGSTSVVVHTFFASLSPLFEFVAHEHGGLQASDSCEARSEMITCGADGALKVWAMHSVNEARSPRVLPRLVIEGIDRSVRLQAHRPALRLTGPHLAAPSRASAPHATALTFAPASPPRFGFGAWATAPSLMFSLCPELESSAASQHSARTLELSLDVTTARCTCGLWPGASSTLWHPSLITTRTRCAARSGT